MKWFVRCQAAWFTLLAVMAASPAHAGMNVGLSLSGGTNYYAGQASASATLDKKQQWEAYLVGGRVTITDQEFLYWTNQYVLGLGFSPNAVWQFGLQGNFNVNEQEVRSGGADVNTRFSWQRTVQAGGESWQEEIMGIGIGLGLTSYSAEIETPNLVRRDTAKRTAILGQNHPYLTLQIPLFTPRLVFSGMAGSYNYSADPLEIANRMSAYPNIALELNALSTGLLERDWQAGLGYDLSERVNIAASYGRQKLVLSQEWFSSAAVECGWQTTERFKISAGWSRSWPGEKTDVVTLGAGMNF